MRGKQITRRRFIRTTAALATTAILPSCAVHTSAKKPTPTAVDQVALGKTGLKLSRLGFGAGSNSGNVQRALGPDGFDRLIRYAYDQGITYIDTADSYKTHPMIRSAIKGLPREKLFIQSKMPGQPENPLDTIDRYRRELGVDYIDSLLTHCAVTADWAEKRKPILDALEQAKQKGIIRAHGVSCHSLQATTVAASLDWVDVNLVRINPQGAHMDTPSEKWDAPSDASHVPAVVDRINIMKAKGHGVIGMKIIGNGDFTKPEDREKSIRFAMKSGLPHAIVIGFKSTEEIDEAIMRMNRALADNA